MAKARCRPTKASLPTTRSNRSSPSSGRWQKNRDSRGFWKTTVTLPPVETLLYGLLVITAILIAAIVFRPSLTATREGKVFAFVAFCILPVVCTSMAASAHLQRSEQTSFCLSCHVMESHGKSLYVDDPTYLAA